MNNALELSQKVCHVCGHPLKKNLEAEKEWCDYEHCQVCKIKFNIPYMADKLLELL